jgi:carotenoid cleavage dioxygenase-like enzyme
MINKESAFTFEFNKEYRGCLGVISLLAESGDEIQCWFDLPQACYVFHTLNAWNEEANENTGEPTKIEMVVTQYDDMPPFERSWLSQIHI